MEFRRIRTEDLDALKEILDNHPEHNGVFDPVNAVAQSIAVEGDRIIAFGNIQRLAEAVFIPSEGASIKERVQSLEKFMVAAIKALSESGIEQLHIFVKDEGFAAVLKKHYGFEEVEAKALVLNLR